jgi:hypothetical protein
MRAQNRLKLFMDAYNHSHTLLHGLTIYDFLGAFDNILNSKSILFE